MAGKPIYQGTTNARPVGLAWFLRARSSGVGTEGSLAKTMTKGFTERCFRIFEYVTFSDGALRGIAPLRGVVEKPTALERGGRLPPFRYFFDIIY